MQQKKGKKRKPDMYTKMLFFAKEKKNQYN